MRIVLPCPCIPSHAREFTDPKNPKPALALAAVPKQHPPPMGSAFRCTWASDHALLVTFVDERPEAARELVLAATGSLLRAHVPGLRNLHPAYASVLVVSDPRRAAPEAFERDVRHALASAAPARAAPLRTVEIPVCYEGEHAPDLEEVARRAGLAADEAARIHAAAEYVVCFLGFTPGFPYLAGLPQRLATPRLAVPRRMVPAGSVAIGGGQAGIYPFATPGGWRLIGRTPLALFRVERDPPALLEPGDRVRFVPIGAARFREMAGRA